MISWLCRLFLLALVGIVAVAGRVEAAVPAATSVEGALLTTAGGGSAADGNYQVTFALYAAETGGTALWSEGPVFLQVSSGRFAAALGATSPFPVAQLASASGLWLGLKVASDPELPRQPWHSVLFARHAGSAEGLTCTGCIAAKQLAVEVLSGYAKTSDLSGYVSTAALSSYAKATDLNGLAKTLDLIDFVKVQSLAKVAGTGKYSDLAGLPVLAKIGASCRTGLVMRGIKADGSYECTSTSSQLTAKDLPSDGLNEVSNGVLTTQFTETAASTNTPLNIPDFSGAGITDTIIVPDLGTVDEIAVQIAVTNSDVSKVRIDLFDPTGAKLVVYDGEKTGTKLAISVNHTSSPMLQAWQGKSPKGTWALVVADLAKGPSNPDGTIDSWSIVVVSNASKKAQVNGNLAITGAITGNAAQWLVPAGAVLAFNLKACPTGWSELVAARGRSVVGLQPGGALAATVGTALSDKEDRPVGKHGHALTDPGHSHPFKIDSDLSYDGGSGAPAGEDSGVYTVNTVAATTNISIAEAGGVAGTNAPYLQLLMCQKQ